MSQVLLVNAVRSRHVVVTWFGNLSYRRLRVTYEVRKMLCPFCLHELEDGQYFGSKVFAKNINAVDYVRDSWLVCLRMAFRVWVVTPESISG